MQIFLAAAVMLCFYCTQTHMKLQSEFSREFLKTIFARLPPLAVLPGAARTPSLRLWGPIQYTFTIMFVFPDVCVLITREWDPTWFCSAKLSREDYIRLALTLLTLQLLIIIIIQLLLHELHWLRMRQRIEYKLAVLVYRCLHGLWAYYNCDSSTIRARYNILRGVMCFRAIMNMSILLCCCRML